jgi:hypothetical protein
MRIGVFRAFIVHQKSASKRANFIKGCAAMQISWFSAAVAGG